MLVDEDEDVDDDDDDVDDDDDDDVDDDDVDDNDDEMSLHGIYGSYATGPRPGACHVTTEAVGNTA